MQETKVIEQTGISEWIYLCIVIDEIHKNQTTYDKEYLKWNRNYRD